MSKPLKMYYTLFIKHNGKWEQEFGSFVKSEVEYEMKEITHYDYETTNSSHVPMKNKKIIQHFPSDDAMLAALAILNEQPVKGAEMYL